MPAWLGAALSALSALLGIPAMIERWQARKQGAQDQKLADDERTLDEARRARRIEQTLTGAGDDELDSGLRKYQRKP